ncbi:MAG: hypothetical protein IKH27_11285 [Oscillospiraceae bacterium]|nr:hypothetical protein [Oscillospiraceae bacterium]
MHSNNLGSVSDSFFLLQFDVCKVPFWIFSLIMIVLIALLDIKNNDWRNRSSFSFSQYNNALRASLVIKDALHDKFSFSTLCEYQMVLKDVKKQNRDIQEEIKERSQRTGQFFFGVIVAIMLAFIPAIITGIMDNTGRMADFSEDAPLSDFVRILRNMNDVLQIAQGVWWIIVLIIVPLIIIYLGHMYNIYKLKKEQEILSDFVDKVKLLVEIVSGLHPLAEELQKELSEKRRNPNHETRSHLLFP